jgi:tetrahydromethanopterin S-methyltransferase subunit H
MARTKVSDEVWYGFHQVVNMTSRELEEWLRTESAGERTEAMPDQAGNPVGAQVVHILGKRRADLTDDDIEVMVAVTGHDPLKPA